MRKAQAPMVMTILIALCVGCEKNSLTYIGNSISVTNTTPTPPGFAITPAQAKDIINLHHGPKKTVDDLYYDTMHYYVIDGFNGSKHSRAKSVGTIINGTTGEIYDRGTGLWTPDPRATKGS